MKLRKIASVAIASTMLLSLAGCSFMTSEPIKNADKALDAAGFKKMASNKSESEYKDAQKDGFYCVVTAKNVIDDLADNLDSDGADINSMIYAYREEGDNEFQVYVVDFKDEDAAQDCFDYLVDFESVDDSDLSLYSTFGDVASTNEDDLYQIAVSVDVEGTSMTLYLDIAIDDNIVTYSRVMAVDDDIEEYSDMWNTFYDELDVKSASDLI